MNSEQPMVENRKEVGDKMFVYLGLFFLDDGVEDS
jgi:hypothetical protein